MSDVALGGWLHVSFSRRKRLSIYVGGGSAVQPPNESLSAGGSAVVFYKAQLMYELLKARFWVVRVDSACMPVASATVDFSYDLHALTFKFALQAYRSYNWLLFFQTAFLSDMFGDRKPQYKPINS